MKHHSLPHNRTAHIAAFIAVVALHGGLLWWQVKPQPPLALPQQQVIRVAMVMASVPEKTPQPVVEQIAVPPAKHGMRKVEKPIPEPVSATEKKHLPRAEAVMEAAASDASAEQSVVTEPVAADYLRNPPPVYPRAALRKRMQGTVMIEVRVGKDGLPLHVRLQRTCGHGLLDEAALEAVRKWRFVPARRGQEVIEASVVVPVEFRIN